MELAEYIYMQSHSSPATVIEEEKSEFQFCKINLIAQQLYSRVGKEIIQ